MNTMHFQLLQHQPCYMESENKSFQPWRDYMKLADIVREMQLWNFTSEPSIVDGHGICSTTVEFEETPPRALLSPITLAATPPQRHEKEPLDSEIVPVRKESPFRPSSSNDPKPATAASRPSADTRAKRMRKTPEVPSPERKFCSVCRKNEESESVFGYHSLKDQDGDVMCPYLWHYGSTSSSIVPRLKPARCMSTPVV